MGLCSRASGNQESRCRTIQARSEISILPVFDFEAHPANTVIFFILLIIVVTFITIIF